jgi:GGDEF domain-containing protein
MAEQLNPSQPAWILLDMLQQQLGVTIEVLDLSMRPLAPAGVADAPSATEEPRIAAETLKSLRTGELRIDRTTGVPVGIFPLRVAKQIAGCLIVSTRPGRSGDTPLPADMNVEVAGHLARTALESDMTLTSQLADARYRNRRVHGILRFLSQLGGTDTERDVMNAVIQAATVWFDVDCRIYDQQPDDSFMLAAALPGIEQRSAVGRLERSRVDRLIASRRFSSGGDLDDLGLAGRRGEVLVLPVGPGVSPEWLLILAGGIDQEVELTFGAIAKVLAGDLSAREAARVELWQRRLAEAPTNGKRAPERILLTLLEALSAEVGATAARVTLATGDSERALVRTTQATPDSAEGEVPGPADHHAFTYTQALPVAPGTDVRLTITSTGDRRTVAQQSASWMKALQPWLREAVAGLAAEESLFETVAHDSTFEQRIQQEVERAKRFNLGLGLVLIASPHGAPAGAALEPLLTAVRSELRASDLMGRIRGGLVAVLLVHAEPVGAESVIARLRQRLGMLPEDERVAALELGRAVFSAECASADELIAQAQRQAQRVELRN